MQDLQVIGVESGALLVASDEGTRYRIVIDEVLQSTLRRTAPDPGADRKLSPKEIQAQIRSGMSAEDVSAVTGVPLEHIQKFEGPVLAEREFVVSSALAVAVHTAAETGSVAASTFGTVIRTRLHDLGAVDERWASWKEVTGGWVVKLSFTADSIERDARWSFEPKKAALAPLNNEAISLSQQGEPTGPLVPRLRAVDSDRVPDQSRFDSGAFARTDDAQDPPAGRRTGPLLETVPYGRLSDVSPQVADAAINRVPEPVAESSQTADLLEALRRRRGERESASYDEDTMAAQPSTGSIRLVDVPLPDPVDARRDELPGSTAPQPGATTRSRKGRTAMPSWDEIVFGARSDDD
ncbi:septation protein SepH [soil metagenome]